GRVRHAAADGGRPRRRHGPLLQRAGLRAPGPLVLGARLLPRHPGAGNRPVEPRAPGCGGATAKRKPSGRLSGVRRESDGGEEMAPDPFEHVMDSHHWNIFETQGWVLHLPTIGNFSISKFMLLQVIAAALICLCYIPLARRARTGE